MLFVTWPSPEVFWKIAYHSSNPVFKKKMKRIPSDKNGRMTEFPMTLIHGPKTMSLSTIIETHYTLLLSQR